jgi:hypothetical protein
MPRRSLTLRFEKENDMVAVTYDVGRAAAGKAERAPRKGLFARFMDALIEARLQQARREIALHLDLLPYSLDERKNRLLKTGSQDMPFGGW